MHREVHRAVDRGKPRQDALASEIALPIILEQHNSLVRLRELPEETRVYCGHDYAAANARFALTVEPDNAALKARAEEVAKLRAANKPTIPTLLGEEKRANVFLRADEPSVAAGVRMKGRSATEVFGELRERKNKS